MLERNGSLNMSKGPQERLRSLVGAKRWDYLIYWNLSDDQRHLEWVGCCCCGADQSRQGLPNLISESPVFLSSHYFEGGGCRDTMVQHSRATACDLLADFPSSIPLDAGIQGQVFLSGQPRWMNFPNIANPNAGQDAVQTKVLIPVRNGLVELFVCKPVAENAALIQFVLTQSDLWLPQIFADSNNLFSVSASASATAGGGVFGSVSETASTLPWLPATATATASDSVPWDSSAADRALSESQLSIHLNFLGQQLQIKPPKNDFFEGSADSINHSDKPTIDRPLQQDNNNNIQATVAAAGASLPLPIMRTTSQLSKENHDKEVKHEFIRADSSDCSDQMEEDVDDQKAVGRSGRRHLSKNLVAERKRRKKLNERLYALRALVPKITKMDRASILGDAIDYIKQLQQQVKELQEELNELDMQAGNPGSPPNLENGVQRAIDDEAHARSSAKSDVTKLAVNEPTDDMVHTMQIEVSQVDTHVFNLRIFSEKRVGGFVRLMQAMDTLGLDILNANITSFRGLVLNVFNAEMRDKEMIQAEQLRQSLLEMTLNPSSSSSGEPAASDLQQRHMSMYQAT